MTSDRAPQRDICLCLSGGGFRATLYHLGVIKALRDANLLRRVTHIFSVSGGSILAGHLVLHWDDYSNASGQENDEERFRRIVRELIDLVQYDVRGRILRKWLLLGWLPRFSREKQLIAIYDDRLFKNEILSRLAMLGRPQLYIASTSMINGELCLFHCGGLRRGNPPKEVTASELHIAQAVAASSAFPPLFPPVSFTRDQVGADVYAQIYEERLTDGGVFDNLGVRAAKLVTQDGLLVISDASARFEEKPDGSFWNVISRTVRTTDVLMSRVAMAEKDELLRSTPAPILADISSVVRQSDLSDFVVSSNEPFTVQEDWIQRRIKSVRTDLDHFSDDEIRAIYLHGVEVGYFATKDLVDPGSVVSTKTPTWDPTSREELSDRVNGSDARRRNASAESTLGETIKRAGRRRVRIWNPRDPYSWVLMIILVIATAVAAGGVTKEVGRRMALSDSRPLDEVLMTSVPEDQWTSLLKSTSFKATAIDHMGIPASGLTTVFFEVPMDDVSTPDNRNGFIKVQLISYPQSATGTVYLRPYSSSSSGEANVKQRIFTYSGSGLKEFLEGPVPHNPSIISIELKEGMDIVICATYAGYSLVSGKWRDGSRRDWHEVEVTDLLSGKRGLEYTFLTGSANWDLRIVGWYEILGDFGAGRLVKRLTPVKDAWGPKYRAFERLERVFALIGKKWDDDIFKRAFAYLSDSGKFRNVRWSGEYRPDQRHDTLYITEWQR